MSFSSSPLQPISEAAGLFIIREQTLRWTTALRLVAPVWKPVRVKSPRVLKERLLRFPASFLLIELRIDQTRSLLPVLHRFRERFPQFRFAVASPEIPELSLDKRKSWEMALREFGAVHVLGADRDVPTLLPILEAHMAALPAIERSFVESVRLRYPWGGKEPS